MAANGRLRLCRTAKSENVCACFLFNTALLLNEQDKNIALVFVHNGTIVSALCQVFVEGLSSGFRNACQPFG